MNERKSIKSLVRGAYDLQRLRIQMGGRIVANFRSKLGVLPGQKDKDISDADSKKLLESLKKQYVLMTDGIAGLPKSMKFSEDGLISNFTELVLISHYFDLENRETVHFKHLGKVLKDYPIYNEFLLDVKGVGPAMAGVIISEIDIHKAKYPSSLWKYAGLDVVDGQGRSRRKEHLIEIEYTAKNGETKTKKGITFNPFLKTKLVGVLGSSFLRAGGHYSEFYYNYKKRIENHVDHVDKSKGWRHNMAIRYMIKLFLVDLHKKWREIEGLPISQSYQEAKLGYVHNE